MLINIENFLYVNNIDIIYRDWEPNDIYSNKYNIVSDGEQIQEDRIVRIHNATMTCNILKDARTVIVISKNNKNLASKHIIGKICETFNLKYII